MLRTNYIIKSVNRCLLVLEQIEGAAGGEATLGRLSRSLGITEATTVKILRDLEARGLIEREAGRTYRLGYGTLRLHEAYLQGQHKQKVREVRPYLEKIAGETLETAYFALFGAHGPICQDVVESTEPVRVVCERGMSFPLEKTAVGKVMLAYTGKSGESLRYRQEIEERGYSISIGEFDPDLTGVAAPVHNHSAVVTAVIGIAGPGFRLGPDRVLNEIAPAVVMAAREVSNRFGFRGS